MPPKKNFLLSLKSNADLVRAIASGAPNYMVMFVTALCNARCPMCFYWKESENADAGKELRLDEYHSDVLFSCIFNQFLQLQQLRFFSFNLTCSA